jgi:hypothetical protein
MDQPRQQLVDIMENMQVARHGLGRVLEELQEDERRRKRPGLLLRELRCWIKQRHRRRNRYCSCCGDCGKLLYAWEFPYKDEPDA